MQLDVVEVSDTTCVLDVRGVTPAFLNALRRTLLSDVPKLAIDEVTIYDNTSALFDEMLAHRLGLLPIPTELNTLASGTAGTREEPVLFTLSKEGPCTVYSGDLVPALDAKMKIRDPKIPIVKLLEGQRVMLECGAVLGIGREHAKWQAVNAVGYMEYPKVTIKPGQIPPATFEKLAKTAPKGIVSFENGTIVVHDPVKAYAYLRSVKKLHDLDMVVLGHEADRWIFRFETDGALPPVDALRRAVSIVMEKLKTVEAEVPKLKVPEIEA
jgi:DNA-directed RNA polymerase subunit D